MENTAIRVNNVSKSFKLDRPWRPKLSLKTKKNYSSTQQNKTLIALDKITFTVLKGEILGIIGLNGSGKTTLLRIIAGIYQPNTGSVEVNGRLSPLMQIGAGFQGDLPAKENIIINGMLLGLSKSQIEKKVDKIIEYAELKKFPNLILKHYSSGMKARLAFATAMQVDPDILLVDEILSVGDKNFKEKSYETFLSFKKKNKTILMATHNLGNLSQICDRLLLLYKGKKVMIGLPEEVLKKYREIEN